MVANANNTISSKVDYLHKKFYGEIDFLKSTQKILNDIIDQTADMPSIQRKAKSELHDITVSLEKLNNLMPAISLIEAYDSIINDNNDGNNETTVIIRLIFQELP